ncbi:hypothetical protein C8J56DRAFT_918349 [Mycena floridula]|nr:hypothetical protein C8J56DRAFT_918349 [Mycena floridula]
MAPSAILCFLLYHVFLFKVQAQTLGLADGFLSFNTTSFAVQLVKDSQTLYSLKPLPADSQSPSFDFNPADMMSQRANNLNYHIGDITFRARQVGTTAWISGDTSAARKTVTASAVSGTTLAAANLAKTLPTNSLLNITRRWVNSGGNLQLLFDVQNPGTVAVEIGALGVPLEFNNIFTGRTAAQTNTLCSLVDPYIGADAGFAQVTPLLGTLRPLVVTGVGASPLEGWRFLPESTSLTPFYQSQTFEAIYEWQFHTLAYAQNEWKAVTPWNAATSFTLQAGQTRTYGLQFTVAPSIRTIESTLQTLGRPVSVGIPGYVVPTDQVGKLFLHYSSAVSSISTSPTGALALTANSEAKTAGWVGYTVTPSSSAWGRVRLSIAFADGTLQTVHYYVTKGAAQAVADLGNFLTTSQWFNVSSDPFKRSPSVISYDRQVNAVVKDDPRAWIPGLSDEAGAGSWLAASMKQYVQPNAAEVAKMEAFVAQTLFGSIQNTNGSVKKAVYFYQPALVPSYNYPTSINWGNWWSWNQAASFATDRGYDYVHVIASYWALYRVARNYPALVKTNTWQWYLNRAFTTVSFLTNGQVGYAGDGLMGETVISLLLDDLKREGLTANATLVQSRMQTRWKAWSTERYPFGSEMAWDSTGQEGVYIWSKFFNDTVTSTNALNSILAYQPSIPHWGYNGNARRYWDNVYGGKLQRIERQIHHYGSGLNAIPLVTAFESSPTDFHLLRVGFGGLSGPLTNIDQGGFAAASFHSFADTLAWDAYSGDYGPNFSGFSLRMGAFIVNHPDFGWQAFGGTITSSSPTVQVQIRDPVRRRVFIASIGGLLTLDAGAFDQIVFNPSTLQVDVTILPAPSGISGAAAAPNARLVLSQTATISGVAALKPLTAVTMDAGAVVINFVNGVATISLSAK